MWATTLLFGPADDDYGDNDDGGDDDVNEIILMATMVLLMMMTRETKGNLTLVVGGWGPPLLAVTIWRELENLELEDEKIFSGNRLRMMIYMTRMGGSEKTLISHHTKKW